MLKKERDIVSNIELNELEHDWWNKYSEIILKVWEMNSNVSKSIRKHYLNQAKSYFIGNKEKVLIYEPGCGSGWVGQILAGPKINILGVDFSETQIKLAIQNANKNKIINHCNYFLPSTLNPIDYKKVDGILIHSFLHHLDSSEIENFFIEIEHNIKKEGKIFIYEPAFYFNHGDPDIKIKTKTKICLKLANKMKYMLNKIFFRLKLIDIETYEDFLKLMETAKNNDWYLSPKEVPFELSSFTKQISTHFKVTHTFWANIYSIGWVFSINLIKKKYLRILFNNLVTPLFVYCDKQIIKDKTFLEKSMIYPTYGFHVWMCTKKTD